MRHKLFAVGLTLLTLLNASALLAHSALSASNPKSGAVLSSSPPNIELKFKDEVRLTSVTVGDRKLTFSPANSSAVFTVAAPELPVGRSEVKWKALSKDGHVVQGTLVFTVQPVKTTP